MREVFCEIFERNFLIIFELLPFFVILDIANCNISESISVRG